ncbi:hypothetical protein VZT92_012378 [Zoarces viviparus]|uniref:Uncharacterized protein n=1 Tax=Zoarces viviparus TaxID=48416 RepID=A0AAW1FBK4_ZOAVI
METVSSKTSCTNKVTEQCPPHYIIGVKSFLELTFPPRGSSEESLPALQTSDVREKSRRRFETFCKEEKRDGTFRLDLLEADNTPQGVYSTSTRLTLPVRPPVSPSRYVHPSHPPGTSTRLTLPVRPPVSPSRYVHPSHPPGTSTRLTLPVRPPVSPSRYVHLSPPPGTPGPPPAAFKVSRVSLARWYFSRSKH